MQFDEFGNIIVSPWAKSTGGGGGSCKFYECASVDDGTGVKSWTGYEWLLTTTEESESVYALSETLTDGLSWTSVKPRVGKTYSDDALIKAEMYRGKLNIPDMVFYAPLDSIDVELGAALTNNGNVTFVENDGMKCARLTGSNYLSANGVAPTGSGELTCCWWSKLDSQTNEAWIFMLGQSGSYRESFFGRYYDYTGFDLSLSNYEVQSTGIIDHTAWSFIAMVHTGAEMKLYINNELKLSDNYSGFNLSSGDLSIGRAGSGPGGYIAGVRIFTRALSDDEITELYEEFA